ncbi:hypothetical protein [Sorangium sp. So ce1389]|uniref:hypothetical protein n=1 Tax=Sorangium sp. So ce1389 TaxID=3133336 RepID=UPI003F5E4BD6
MIVQLSGGNALVLCAAILASAVIAGAWLVLGHMITRWLSATMGSGTAASQLAILGATGNMVVGASSATVLATGTGFISAELTAISIEQPRPSTIFRQPMTLKDRRVAADATVVNAINTDASVSGVSTTNTTDAGMSDAGATGATVATTTDAGMTDAGATDATAATTAGAGVTDAGANPLRLTSSSASPGTGKDRRQYAPLNPGWSLFEGTPYEGLTPEQVKGLEFRKEQERIERQQSEMRQRLKDFAPRGCVSYGEQCSAQSKCCEGSCHDGRCTYY